MKRSLKVISSSVLIFAATFAQAETSKLRVQDQMPAPELKVMGTTTPEVPETTSAPVTNKISAPVKKSRGVSDWFGVSYAVFFSGPGLSDQADLNPNHIGRPNDDGLFTQNTISFRFKLWEKWALDLQTRTRYVFNDSRPANRRQDSFQAFRWESPSVGVSGELAKGDDWVLKGAINTDFPYTMGEPFAGFTSVHRKTLLTPGMFASLRWAPKGTRWSVFSIVNPRWYIYEDRLAVEPMFIRAGRIAQNKREFDLSFRPSVNYLISEKVDISVGTAVSYNKQVGSSWNPFNASVVQNGDGPEWRLDPLPLQVGSTVNISKEFRLFGYVQGFPIAQQRFDARPEVQKTIAFKDTLSVGLDLTGTLF